MLSVSGKSTGTRVAAPSATKSTRAQQSVASKGGGNPARQVQRVQQRKKKATTTSSSSSASKQKPTVEVVVEAKAVSPPKPKSIKDIAEERLRLDDQYNQEKCIVRFNHYKKEFPLHNRVLKWIDVDEEYAMSYVYRGDYKRHIYQKREVDKTEPEDGRQYEKSDGQYFLVDSFSPDNREYWLEVIEDEEAGCGIEGLTVREGPIIASQGRQEHVGDVKSGNFAMNEITEQLKAMDVKDLHNEEAKRLREARDIEDILYT